MKLKATTAPMTPADHVSEPGLARRAASTLRRGTLALLYPPLCLGCDARVAHDDDPLCRACLKAIERPTSEILQAQLDRLPPEAHTLDAAHVLFRYDKGGRVQRVQHALKYNGRPRYGVLLGRLAGDHLGGYLPAADALVPVPLHRVRFLERGYNQSTQLALGLADVLGFPVREEALSRSGATRSQARLGRSARWDNVRAAFHAPMRLDGQRLLVVDDVLTTGATAAAAAGALREAGAASVELVTLAFAR